MTFSLQKFIFRFQMTSKMMSDGQTGPEFKYVTNKAIKILKKLATSCKPGSFLHSTCPATCQRVEQVDNLIDLSRHVVGMLATGCKLVGNPVCQPGLATSFQLVRLCGLKGIDGLLAS